MGKLKPAQQIQVSTASSAPEPPMAAKVHRFMTKKGCMEGGCKAVNRKYK
jgi:hypothetical protein